MYKTMYQAAFWTMRKTEAQLPDLNELVRRLAVSKQQQQQPPPAEQQGHD